MGRVRYPLPRQCKSDVRSCDGTRSAHSSDRQASCSHDYMLYDAPWPESASKLFLPNDRLLAAKLVPTFADRGCYVVSVTHCCGRILGFLYRSRYFIFQVSPHEAEWTPFQTHCFSENLVAPGMEPGPLDL
jgi:hypothetical protein